MPELHVRICPGCGAREEATDTDTFHRDTGRGWMWFGGPSTDRYCLDCTTAARDFIREKRAGAEA